MSTVPTFTAADTAPPLTGSVGCDVTGATLEAHIRWADATITSRAATVTDAAMGTWSLAWQPTDLTSARDVYKRQEHDPMAFTFANRGLYTLLNSAVSGTTDLRQAVFTGTVPSAATIRDWNFLSDVIADATSAEAVASGYARADLAGVTLAEDDALDKVTLVASAPTYTCLLYTSRCV